MPAKKANLSKILLRLIDSAVDITSEWESYSEFCRRLYGIDQKRVAHTLSNLKYRGLVTKNKDLEKEKYVLTDLGKAFLLKEKYHRVPQEKRSDDLLTVIIFDIPEEKRGARKFLHRFLGENGFEAYQRSVFIGPYLLRREEFETMLREMQIVDCVTVISGILETQKRNT